MQFFGSLAVILAAMSWATGSIYGLRAPVPKSSLLTAGMQMLSGGLVMLAVSLVTGEMARFDINQVSANSIYGLIYLIICGSLIGFTAYSWLLKNANPAMVSTYAYINPVVAVFLGWLIAGESFTSQMLFGAAVIVGSVVLITSRDDEDKGSPERTEIHESNMPKGTLSASA
jgi:drug/metabolite transporter (DMT)-like permease